MPKRSQARRFKNMRKHQQDELRRAEQASLEQLLKEKNLYRPGMMGKEMQELCNAIEQSALDHEMYQQSSRFNKTFPEEPSGSKEKVNDQPPYGQTLSELQFYPATSPKKSKNTTGPNSACWAAEDSDSDGFYSPEFPGPCCRQTHIVQVEVHPEPQADEKDNHKGMVQQIISPRKRHTVPANEWDSIDEF
ncbi:uncharacterized protein LOC135697624 isoform X2 [Ochlerotatus camptorhynchus]|uniref:uncharacterized protein LOC135697624 isoform X2 n=1 Tax=Ochlerotatus camptorhynchus TaxID=644619 RepID=UPI0031DD59E3